jgi:hypothetical protein
MKIAALLFVLMPVHAAEISCPDRWTPNGWIVQGSAPGARVRDAGVMVGPIQNRGDLRGSERKAKGGYDVRFAGLGDYVEPLDRWVYCSYGLDARLLRKLPDSTSECVARVRGKAATVQCN